MDVNCLYCNAKIVVGRADRKFCDRRCRSAYHNQQRKVNSAKELAVNKLLRNNRSILKKLSPEGRGVLRKEVLDSYDYCFTLFTNLYITQKGNVYYFSYDYGFSPTR